MFAPPPPPADTAFQPHAFRMCEPGQPRAYHHGVDLLDTRNWSTDAFEHGPPLPQPDFSGLVRAGKPASELLRQFEPVPQLLKNVRYSGGAPLEAESVKACIADARAELEGRGRVVIRASGTEPLIRVMAEGDDAGEVEEVVDAVCDSVRAAS